MNHFIKCCDIVEREILISRLDRPSRACNERLGIAWPTKNKCNCHRGDLRQWRVSGWLHGQVDAILFLVGYHTHNGDPGIVCIRPMTIFETLAQSVFAAEVSSLKSQVHDRDGETGRSVGVIEKAATEQWRPHRSEIV